MKWFWVDFDTSNDEVALLLKNHFDFHPLAIEDCLHFLQRPKLDYYGGYNFFVLHTFNQYSLAPEDWIYLSDAILLLLSMNDLQVK
ncbi:CorA family divalent cation transporter [Peribacillus sp. V2I11]|uniref:CorA family divalent cation transporter n=1 Tax=Peribacillus sp. V2I11 TaxID=3042277 RepID=UPI0035940670